MSEELYESLKSNSDWIQLEKDLFETFQIYLSKAIPELESRITMFERQEKQAKNIINEAEETILNSPCIMIGV